MTADAEIVVAIRSDLSGARVVKRNLDDIANSGDKTSSSMQRAERQMQSLDRTADLLQRTLLSLGGAYGILSILKTADAYNTLVNKMRVVTTGAGDLERALEGVQRVARDSLSSLDATATLFSRLTIATKDLGYSQNEVLRITQAINQTFRLSGATASEAANSAIQLAQGLASGALRGDELRSVMEGNIIITQLLAKELNTNVGTLKDLAAEGKLTAEVVGKALLKSFDDLNAQAAKLPPTLSQSVEQFKNSFMIFLGETDRATGATQSLSKLMVNLSQNIDLVTKAALALAAAALPATIVSATRAVTGFTAALLANPIGLIASAVSAGVTALILFEDKIKLTKDGTVTLGNAAKVIFDDITEVITTSVNTIKTFFSEIMGGLDKILSHPFWRFGEQRSQAGFTYHPELSGNGYFNGVLARAREQARKDAIDASAKDMTKAGAELMQRGLAGEQMTFNSFFGIGKNKPKPPTGDTEAALKALKAAQKEIAQLVKETYTDQERYNARVKELESLRGYAKTAEEVRAIDRALKAAADELEKIRVEAEKNGPMAKAFASLASEIDGGFKDAFKDAFKESDGGWKKLLSGWKATFKDFLAELAYMALARPIVLSVVGGIGGSMGVSSNAVASILGTGTGSSGGIGSLSSLSNLSSLFGSNQMLTGTVNKIGSFLGIGGVGPAGPTSLSSMTSFTNGSFGGTLGAGLGGFGGNMLANAILGDRGVGASVGGTIGAIAGSFIPIPIVGPAIGAFLGNAIGGMFGGGGLQRQTLATNLGVNASGFMQHSGGAAKNGKVSDANKFGEQITKALNGIIGLTGGQFTKGLGTIETNVGKKDPGTFIGSRRVSDKPGDIAAVVRSVINNQGYFSGADSDILGVAQRSLGGTSDLNKVMEDVALAKLILDDSADTSLNYAKAIEDINKQFDDLFKRATDLGIPLEKFTETLSKQKDAAIGAVKAMEAGFNSMESMTMAFKAFLDGQALSGNSSLSPMGKLQLAQDNFGSLLSKAQGGDLSVTQNLLAAASQLLDIGRGVYASTVSFAGLEQFVRSSITEIARAAGVPGYASGTLSAASGWAMVGERGPELVNFRGGERVYNNSETTGIMGAVGTDIARTNAHMTATLSDVAAEIKQLRTENAKMRKQLERVADRMVVGQK